MERIVQALKRGMAKLAAAPDCPASHKCRQWLQQGGEGLLELVSEDFPDQDDSLVGMLFSGPPRQQLRQHARSLCAYVGRFTPYSGWKCFWFRLAGAKIGKNVYIAPGAVLDLLFPQLIELEDGAVLGMDAMLVAHVYTPEKIVVGRVRVGKKALVGGRAVVLAGVSLGERAVLGACSLANRNVPAGRTALGVPAKLRTRKAAAGETEHDELA